MSLVARHLEQAGFPSVVVGSARDIVEQAAVARFVFTDLPLGNPCGPPGDPDAQRLVVDTALNLFESAFLPRTTVQAPVKWPDNDWRASYMAIGSPDGRGGRVRDRESKTGEQRDRLDV